MGGTDLKKKVAVLGSTGSIGTQTLKVCKRAGYEVTALAANRSADILEQQAREFTPRRVAIFDENAYKDLKVRLADMDIDILTGMDGLCELTVLDETEIVCNAVIGMIGLRPTLAAIAAKKTLALSNKETLVAGGQLVMESAEANGVKILPVDSEHSAIFQCLQGNLQNPPRRILLTASGGPFRGYSKAELERVTLEDALKHPNWSMGAKITIDSSTLMNKGLEFIEAMWLFGISPDQIEVIVHPQSVVHSAVEYADGSVIAQMGVPDMEIPIQYALTYPKRIPGTANRLLLSEMGSLTFEPPDLQTFSCLADCMRAASMGGLFPCAVNSANEQAVALFLQNRIRYTKIADCVHEVLERFDGREKQAYTLEMVLEADRAAREMVLEYCGIG